jgi:hypothetical protein
MCIFCKYSKKMFLWLYTLLIYIVSFKYNHSANHIACSFILRITSLLSHVLLRLINHITNWTINYVSYHMIQSYYFIQTITSSLCHILLHSIENIITCVVSHLINHIVTWVINFVILHPILHPHFFSQSTILYLSFFNKTKISLDDEQDKRINIKIWIYSHG